jgi:hypothetical protein
MNQPNIHGTLTCRGQNRFFGRDGVFATNICIWGGGRQKVAFPSAVHTVYNIISPHLDFIFSTVQRSTFSSVTELGNFYIQTKNV